MKKQTITFNGYNINEIAQFTGRNAKMSIDTEVRNCSKEFPEGFDYPYAQIESPDGWINLSLNKAIDKDLLIH